MSRVMPWSEFEWASSIEQTDKDEHLELYSYRECERDAPTQKQALRGVVYSASEPPTLIVPSFGYNPEYTEEETSTLNLPLDTYRFYLAEEGTLLRLFFHGSKWYLSTHRKLDAFQSRWGNDLSFGDLFVDALANVGEWGATVRDARMEHFTHTLSRDTIYVFLLRSHYRWICMPPESPTAIHIGSFVASPEGHDECQWQFDMTNPLAGFATPTAVSFRSWQEAADHVKGINPFSHQGVIGFTDRGASIKLMNSIYQSLSAVRGNESSLLYRYLTIRNDHLTVQQLMNMYPEKHNWFVSVETTLMQIAFMIHAAYVNRFVKKHYVVLPAREYTLLKACHSHYLADREKNRITLPVVHSILHQHPSVVHALIKQQWQKV